MNRIVIYALVLLLAGAAVFLSIRVYKTSDEEPPVSPVSPAPLVTKESRTPHLIHQLVHPGKHLAEQIDALRRLPDDLDEVEFEGLVEILRQPCPEKVEAGRWYTLQNEVMEVLRQPRFDWDGYVPAMAGLVSDRHADPVMRDYAAQHLALYLTDRADSLTAEAKELAVGSLLEVLEGGREAHQQVMGTTLMALCDLDSHHPAYLEPHRPALQEGIGSLVRGDTEATMANRISAIQAAGRMGFDELRPLVRGLAADETLNPSLRLSSVAALGYFADPTDRPFLSELAASGDRLRFAAQTALESYEP